MLEFFWLNLAPSGLLDMLIFALDFWQVTLFLSVLIICVAYNYITAAPELSGLMFLYAFVCLLVKGIRPVKNRVVGYWRGYLSGARCRLAYGPADATATHCLLLQ